MLEPLCLPGMLATLCGQEEEAGVSMRVAKEEKESAFFTLFCGSSRYSSEGGRSLHAKVDVQVGPSAGGAPPPSSFRRGGA